ncbi:MAG: hypothetical protein NT145_03655, partial [Elusimicrobia bacterium]|nr:hypothetical protein [Elusimicrobiota bacterium]
ENPANEKAKRDCEQNFAPEHEAPELIGIAEGVWQIVKNGEMLLEKALKAAAERFVEMHGNMSDIVRKTRLTGATEILRAIYLAINEAWKKSGDSIFGVPSISNEVLKIAIEKHREYNIAHPEAPLTENKGSLPMAAEVPLYEKSYFKKLAENNIPLPKTINIVLPIRYMDGYGDLAIVNILLQKMKENYLKIKSDLKFNMIYLEGTLDMAIEAGMVPGWDKNGNQEKQTIGNVTYYNLGDFHFGAIDIMKEISSDNDITLIHGSSNVNSSEFGPQWAIIAENVSCGGANFYLIDPGTYKSGDIPMQIIRTTPRKPEYIRSPNSLFYSDDKFREKQEEYEREIKPYKRRTYFAELQPGKINYRDQSFLAKRLDVLGLFSVTEEYKELFNRLTKDRLASKKSLMSKLKLPEELADTGWGFEYLRYLDNLFVPPFGTEFDNANPKGATYFISIGKINSESKDTPAVFDGSFKQSIIQNVKDLSDKTGCRVLYLKKDGVEELFPDRKSSKNTIVLLDFIPPDQFDVLQILADEFPSGIRGTVTLSKQLYITSKTGRPFRYENAPYQEGFVDLIKKYAKDFSLDLFRESKTADYIDPKARKTYQEFAEGMLKEFDFDLRFDRLLFYGWAKHLLMHVSMEPEKKEILENSLEPFSKAEDEHKNEPFEVFFKDKKPGNINLALPGTYASFAEELEELFNTNKSPAKWSWAYPEDINSTVEADWRPGKM